MSPDTTGDGTLVHFAGGEDLPEIPQQRKPRFKGP
jgi:hypothetical protein